MNWISIISEDLPRLRLYASAALGSPAKGDLALEAALREFFETYLQAPLDRRVLYRLLYRQARAASGMPVGERTELLKHVGGFNPVEANEITDWDNAAPRRSAG